MRALLVVVLLFAVTACGSDYRTMNEQGKRIVSGTDVERERTGLPGEAAPALAAFDSVGWAERGPDASEDRCRVGEFDVGKSLFTEWRLECFWNTTRYYGADALPDKQAIHDKLTGAGWSLSDPASVGSGYTRTTGDQQWRLLVETGLRDQVPPWSLARSSSHPLPGYAHWTATELDHAQVFRELTGRHPVIVRFSVHATYVNQVVDD